MEFDDHFENDDEISKQRFGDLLDNASYLLDVANAGNRNVQPDEIANIGDIRRDTLNMRKNKEMFKFLAKLTKEEKGVPSPPYSGLSEEYVERMRKQIAGTKTSSGGTRANPSANEVSERGKIDIPDTWPQRRDYVEAWFREHGTKITPDSLEVARQWVAKTVEALARAKRKAVEGDPSLKNMRYVGNVSGVFGSGYSLGGDFSDVDKIIIGQLRETDPNITNVSNQDYARMGIREIAAALGLNLKDTTPDFDEIFR